MTIDVFFCSIPDDSIRMEMAELCFRRWESEPGINLTSLVLEKGDKREFQRDRRIQADELATSEFYVLTDDDCLLETTKPHIERAVEIMRRHPDFALISWLPINCDIIPWRPGPGEHKFLVGGTQFSDNEVMEHVNAGGIRLCRKGAMKDWPELPAGMRHYDGIHCARLRELGWRSGYFRNLRQLHIGRHYSIIWDGLQTDPEVKPPEKEPTYEELEKMVEEANNSALNAFCCLTFDDDDVEYWMQVAAAIEPYGAKITCFVTTINIRREEEPILVALASFGHEIGIHGRNHIALTNHVDDREAFWKSEIIDPATQIERLIGKPVTSHAMPYGATSKELRDWLRTTPLIGARTAAHRLQSIQNADPYDISVIDRRQIIGDGSEGHVRANSRLLYDICRQNNALFIVYAHHADEMSPKQIRWMVDEISQNGGRFITFSDMLRAIRNQV